MRRRDLIVLCALWPVAAFARPHKGSTDPHDGIEYELMEAGKKRLAYLFKYDDRFEKHYISESYLFNGRERFLIYKSSDGWWSNCFMRSDAMFLQGKISMVRLHARRGILLDYDKADIRGYSCGRGQSEKPL